MALRESALIELFTRRARGDRRVAVGIGDDAAVLRDPHVVVAHDMVVEDVHFRWATATPADVGHKALAVNVSDMAAMGAQPIAALVGLAVGPGPLDLEGVTAMYRAMDALGAFVGCPVVGGDTSSARQTVVGVTILGVMDEGVAAVTRAGGRPGHGLYVTGPLGASVAGLHLLEGHAPEPPEGGDALRQAHRRPTPHLAHGRALAAAGVPAMLDCSDGLALDAARLAAASDCRAVITLDTVPRAAGVDAVAAAMGVEPALFAATGGEDFVLIVARPDDAPVPEGVTLHRVGYLEEGHGLEMVRAGQPVHHLDLGWDHVVG